MVSKPNIETTSDAAIESLWALGRDGMLWQINPLNSSAAPVLPLDELPQRERRLLQRHMLLRWSRPRTSPEKNNVTEGSVADKHAGSGVHHRIPHLDETL